DGRALLTDFGLAKEVARGEAITATGQVLGTPAYMSPEQAQGDPQLIDRRSDVYGLGATLYALLTGRPPFRGATVWNVLDAVANQAPAPPRALRPELEHDLETIVLTCLEKEPDQRYGTMQALRDDLQRYLDDQPISARRPSLGERLRRGLRRRRRLVLAGGVLGLALVAVASASWFRATAANVAAAQEAAREARERCAAAERAPLAERTGLALRALQTALLRYEVEGASAERDLVQATVAFARVAAEGRQWSVGLEALKQTELLERLGRASREELTQERAALEQQRQELAKRRVAEVERVLADLESGKLADVSDAVVIITRNPGPETIQLLSARLHALNDELDRGTRAALLEIAQPNDLELAAGEAPIEGVAEAWARFSDPSQRPRREPALAEIGERLVQRSRIQISDRRAVAGLLGAVQDKLLSDRRVRLLSALCRSLGQLGAEESFPLLARNFRLWLIEGNAQAAARGLYWLGTPTAIRFLVDHQERFGGAGTSLYQFVTRRCGQPSGESSALARILERAKAALREGEPTQAMRLLERAYELAGRELPSAQPEILARIAITQLHLGKLEQARASAHSALRQSPSLIRAHLVLGQVALLERDLPAALKFSREALTLGPENPSTHTLRAQVLVEQGEASAAQQAIQRALELDPQNHMARFVQAKLAARRGDWDAALAALDDYLEQTPYDLEARTRSLAFCLWSGRFEEVLARSAKLLATEGLSTAQRVHALYRRGHAAIVLEERGLAERAFLAIREADPASPLSALGIAQLNLRSSRLDVARAAFEEAKRLAQATTLQPREKDRLLLIEIQLLVFSGQVRAALELCDRQLALDERLVLVRTTRADLKLKLNDLAGAQADLARCLEQDPTDFAVLTLLGYVRLFERRFAESEQVFDKLLTRGRGMRTLMGRAMARMGQRKFAGVVQDTSAALKQGSQETELLLLRGQAYAAQAQFALARRDFEAALRQGSPRQRARAQRDLAKLPR
ncbi:MAG TPA: hypothetical protein DEA08_22570, partial [Planctomycetes bacterium]|nr:hypothetical protein [Planctomycetota bacterium]